MQLLVALPGFLLAASGWSCLDVKPAPTDVDVVLTVPEVYYDYSMTKKELTERGKDRLETWKKEHGLTGSWYHFETTGAVMGGWAYALSYRIAAARVDRYGTHWCPYFKQIQMDVIYRTRIMVASDYKQGSCEFEQTMARITEFHNSNTRVFDKYTSRLDTDLETMALHMEARGYSPRPAVEQTMERFRGGIKDAVDVYFSAMSDKITETKKKINTPEHVAEYGRNMRKCTRP